MSDAASRSGPPLSVLSTDCWNRIGIAGDRSCPELESHIHCRNCPVFASAARTFFDRSAPEGYLSEWTRWLAGSMDLSGLDPGESVSQEGQLLSVLIFRLGREWLALSTQAVAEVTTARPVHRIPHRSGEILIGLISLSGQLQLCVSLHGLLGVARVEEAPAAGSALPQGSRVVVLRDRERSETWVFPTEEVLGVHRLPRSRMQSVSSALANPDVNFSQAILAWEGRSVGFLDEQRVFTALRSIGQ
jgi:chemotaxis-related protein WspD